MTMGFKYQLLACSYPAEIMEVTLNHLNAIRQMVAPDETTLEYIDNFHVRFLEVYGGLAWCEWALLRQTLCNFFQGRKVKVSLFLNGGLQNPDGSIVLPQGGPLPPDTDIPGTVK